MLAEVEERHRRGPGRRERDQQRPREARELGPVCGALLLPLRAPLLDHRRVGAHRLVPPRDGAHVADG